MNTRRGFTLVELLIVMVILALVGGALTRVLLNSMRVTAGQMVQADMQSNVRTGGLVLPLELREIGYDSNITTNVVTSDIELINTSYVQFRAGRGFSMTCGTPSLTEMRIRKPAYGLRQPVATDGFMLYVENDPNTGNDDQWIPLTVTAIDPDGLCGADSAIVLSISNPEVSPGVVLPISSVFVGGPIRYYEVMRFGSYVDADGSSYVGARSISAGEAAYRAVAGPVAAGTTGFRLQYYSRSSALLDPSTANPASVRAIEVQITGATRNTATLAGTLPRTTRSMFTRTRVALRNTLRH